MWKITIYLVRKDEFVSDDNEPIKDIIGVFLDYNEAYKFQHEAIYRELCENPDLFVGGEDHDCLIAEESRGFLEPDKIRIYIDDSVKIAL